MNAYARRALPLARGLLLLIATLAPIAVGDHWFQSDDYLLLAAYGTKAPWDFADIFSEQAFFFWRPLQGWLVSVLHALAGLDPTAYNATLAIGWGAGLHAFERVVREATGRPLFAFLALGMCVAMAPAVAMIPFWVSLLGSAWGAALGLWATLLVLRASTDEAYAARLLALAAGLFAAATLLKETLAIMPVFAAVLLWAKGTPLTVIRRPAWLAAAAAAVLVAALSLAMNLNANPTGAMGAARQYATDSLLHTPLNALAMLNYLTWAWGSPSHVGVPETRWLWVLQVGPPVASPLLLLLAAASRNRWALAGAAWAIISCFPSALLASHLDSRYLHLPMFGLALAGAGLADVLADARDGALRRYVSRSSATTVSLGLGLVGVLLMLPVHEHLAKRREYGRALREALADIRLPEAPRVVIFLHNLPQSQTNRGLGLTELARLITHNDSVVVEHAEVLVEDLWRQHYLGGTHAIVSLEFDGKRFRPYVGATRPLPSPHAPAGNPGR